MYKYHRHVYIPCFAFLLLSDSAAYTAIHSASFTIPKMTSTRTEVMYISRFAPSYVFRFYRFYGISQIFFPVQFSKIYRIPGKPHAQCARTYRLSLGRIGTGMFPSVPPIDSPRIFSQSIPVRNAAAVISTAVILDGR